MEKPIVNPSSHAPEPINFTFNTKASWLKHNDALAVTNVDGVVVFQIRTHLSNRDRYEFIDNTGKTVFSMKKKEHINSFSYLEGSRRMETSIVNPNSRAPEPINFTFYTKASWLKPDDALAVTGVDGVVVFQVKRPLWSRDRHQFIDNTGKIVLSMKKKTERSNEQWRVFKGDSSHPEYLLFTMKKSPNFDSEEVFDLFLQTNTAEKKCDYKIEGSYRQKTCILYDGDSSTVVFKMSRRSRSENCVVSQEEAFKVAGQGSMDHQSVVAVVAFLHVHHSKQEKKVTKGKKVIVAQEEKYEKVVFGKWDEEEKEEKYEKIFNKVRCEKAVCKKEPTAE